MEKIEKLRRTGYSAFAEYDGLLWSRAVHRSCFAEPVIVQRIRATHCYSQCWGGRPPTASMCQTGR